MMRDIGSLTTSEIEVLVREQGAPPEAPLVMPKQVLEASRAGRLRAMLARLSPGNAPHREL
ncbi:MAG: hypothetical protein LBE86_06715 [Gemmobacter sp.]|nr:hypothetical protein [Gemmobacter sp.]